MRKTLKTYWQILISSKAKKKKKRNKMILFIYDTFALNRSIIVDRKIRW